MKNLIFNGILIVAFHIFLILWAIFMAYRPTTKRIIIFFTLGVLSIAYILRGFISISAMVNPSYPNMLIDNHIFAIIPYTLIMALLSLRYRYKMKKKQVQKK